MEGDTAASLGHRQSLIIRKVSRISKSASGAVARSGSGNDGCGFVGEGAFVADGVYRGNGVVVGVPRYNSGVRVCKVRDYRGKGEETGAAVPVHTVTGDGTRAGAPGERYAMLHRWRRTCPGSYTGS